VTVLDVGNCTPDHVMIRRMLTDHFDVNVDRVMFVSEALERMKQQAYALILVNRLIFEDGSDGLELLRQSRRDLPTLNTPIMLVSNYPEAQARAIEAGAAPGFGKATIGSRQTIEMLSRYLPTRH